MGDGESAVLHLYPGMHAVRVVPILLLWRDFVTCYCCFPLASYIYGDDVTSQQNLKADSVSVSCALKISLEPKYFSVWAFFCCKSVFTHFFFTIGNLRLKVAMQFWPELNIVIGCFSPGSCRCLFLFFSAKIQQFI